MVVDLSTTSTSQRISKKYINFVSRASTACLSRASAAPSLTTTPPRPQQISWLTRFFFRCRSPTFLLSGRLSPLLGPHLFQDRASPGRERRGVWPGRAVRVDCGRAEGGSAAGRERRRVGGRGCGRGGWVVSRSQRAEKKNRQARTHESPPPRRAPPPSRPSPVTPQCSLPI